MFTYSLALWPPILIFARAACGQPELYAIAAGSLDPTASVNSLVTQLLDPNSDYTLHSPGITVHIKNQQYSPVTNEWAIGRFANGNIAPGTAMNDAVDPNATFSGGIGVEAGVCLSTGFVSDFWNATGNHLPYGVEGANNGIPIDATNPGEVSKVLDPGTVYHDEDFQAVHPDLNTQVGQGGDPAVLQFQIDLNSPGFLRVSFVFASDEFPAWLQQGFNDSFAILVKGPCTPESSPGDNLATFVDHGVTKKFSLTDLQSCSAIFRMNQISPRMINDHPATPHRIGPPFAPANYYTFYDHEYGGFSTVLTRETKKPLAPGRYTIKFVMEDVLDRKVDSTLFMPEHSVKLFALKQGDYNGSGCVDTADYVIWRNNRGKTPADFYDGDGSGNCVVDDDDYWWWAANVGRSGNRDFRADFNRDGAVDETDTAIHEQYWGILNHCASRFEGDADGDGDVDEADFFILGGEFGSPTCGCCTEMQMMAAGRAPSKEAIPTSADVNGDGVVDETDLGRLDAIILGGGASSQESSVAGPEPTLAEPE